jgi:hypothetical protein
MKIEVPTSLDDVSITQYRHLEALQEIDDEQTRLVRQVAFLCSIEEHIVRNMEYQSLQRVLKAMEGLMNPPANFELQRFIEIEGVKYGFHPNLSKLTTGEFADIETYSKDGPYNNLEAILSILYRPVKEEHGIFYTIEPYKGSDREKFKDVPMSVALGAWAFFLRTAINLQLSFANSLKGAKEAT